MLFLELDCSDIELLKVIYFIRVLLNIVFVIVPIGAIIMLSFDFLKNVIANRDDDMKKNLNIFIRRVIYLVAIFFVYTLVNYSTSLVNVDGVSGSRSWLTCWKRTNPSNPYDGILSGD